MILMKLSTETCSYRTKFGRVTFIFQKEIYRALKRSIMVLQDIKISRIYLFFCLLYF